MYIDTKRRGREGDVRIAPGDIDLGEIPHAGDLDIIRCLNKMNTLQRSIRNNPRPPSRSRTPRNLLPLRIADRPKRGRSPETKVVDGVDPGCLAEGGGGGGGAAGVCA